MRRLMLPATILSLSACAVGMSGPPVPVGMVPVTAQQVRKWVMSTRPAASDTLRFHWHAEQEQGGNGGKGIVLLTAGDSLRFDFAGPAGFGRGAAFVVGDSAIWAQPEEDVKKIVPSYPLLWAMLGAARLPGRNQELRGIENGKVIAWQYIGGRDTVTYVHTLTGTGELSADVHEGGKQIGYVVTKFDSLGRPSQSVLRVKNPALRLNIDIYLVKPVRSFPKGSWDAPRDSL